MSSTATTAEQRSPRRGMCAAVLSLEAVTVGLSVPVMISLSDVRVSTALLAGLGLALACLLLAGVLRSETAYVVGFVLQAGAIGLGFIVPAMFLLGVVFAMLWGAAYFLGRKIERERAAAYAARAAGSGPGAGGDGAGGGEGGNGGEGGGEGDLTSQP